jgi:hypothetical protein
MKKIKFKDIPVRCNYAAIDSEGRLKAFDTKPIKTQTGWERTGQYVYDAPVKGYKGNWENSLIKSSVKFEELNDRQKFLLRYYDLAFNLIAQFFEFEDECRHLEWFDIDYFYQALTKDYNKLSSIDIPSGYKYAAVNQDGNAFAFKNNPDRTIDFWYDDSEEDEEDSIFIGRFNSLHWEHSLVSNITDNEKTK